MKYLHMGNLILLFTLSTSYEILYILCVEKEIDETSSNSWLINLAILESLFNLSCVFAVILLGYMMDKMTDEVIDKFKEPIFG